MNPQSHEAARCQNGFNCSGPGCRVHTGKTQRKANYARPHTNKHEGTRITQPTTTKRGR